MNLFARLKGSGEQIKLMYVIYRPASRLTTVVPHLTNVTHTRIIRKWNPFVVQIYDFTPISFFSGQGEQVWRIKKIHTIRRRNLRSRTNAALNFAWLILKKLLNSSQTKTIVWRRREKLLQHWISVFVADVCLFAFVLFFTKSNSWIDAKQREFNLNANYISLNDSFHIRSSAWSHLSRRLDRWIIRM
jgi:hypothetical protein